MNGQRWILALPPEGAARSVALQTANAFSSLFDQNHFKTFDAATYLQGYRKLLRSPDDTMVIDLFNQSFAVSCFDVQPTHCLVMALAPVTLFTLQLLRKHGITTVHWFIEDYLRATYWESVLDGYDHFFAVQHGRVEKRCEHTSATYHFLPTASSAAEHTPAFDGERTIDAVFIGIPSPYRITVLEALYRAGCRLAIAGSGWEQYRGVLQSAITTAAWVNEEQSFALMERAKTGINLSFEAPGGRENIQISPRAFDLMAAGCIPVCEDVPLLDETIPDARITRFSTIEEAVSRVQEILGNYSPDDTRIARNRDLVSQHHRYIHRVERIIRESV